MHANMPPDDIFEEIVHLTRPNYVLCMQSNADGTAVRNNSLLAVFSLSLATVENYLRPKLMRNDDIGADACCGNAL